MKFNLKAALLLCILGLGAGFINGLLGAGGGVLAVLGLRRLFRKSKTDGRALYATTIAVMLPLSAFSAWQYSLKGGLPSIPFFGIALPAILGGIVGALLLRKISPRFLHRIFALTVLIAGVFMVI